MRNKIGKRSGSGAVVKSERKKLNIGMILLLAMRSEERR